MKFHTGKRPYQCQVCGKTFVLRQNLQEHVVRHNKHQLLNCGHCNMRFSNRELLIQHQMENHIATNEKSEETSEATKNISVLDLTDGEVSQMTSYEVTIDNSVLDSLNGQ